MKSPNTKIVVLFLLICHIALGQAQKKRPNIIYIMSDDHTSQAIGVYGGRLAKLNPTPNLDVLAKEGILLQQIQFVLQVGLPLSQGNTHKPMGYWILTEK